MTGEDAPASEVAAHPSLILILIMVLACILTLSQLVLTAKMRNADSSTKNPVALKRGNASSSLEALDPSALNDETPPVIIAWQQNGDAPAASQRFRCCNVDESLSSPLLLTAFVVLLASSMAIVYLTFGREDGASVVVYVFMLFTSSVAFAVVAVANANIRRCDFIPLCLYINEDII